MAASLLVHNPNTPITNILLDCGFSSSSVFARAFKERFGQSASKWRKEKIEELISKKGQTNSNSSEVSEKLSEYFGEVFLIKRGDAKMSNAQNLVTPKNIEVKSVNEFSVAYIRYIGPYKGNSELFENLFTRLFNWAMPKNLCQFPQTKVLSIYHDNPDITDEDKLRTSICISVPDNTEAGGEIGKMKVAGATYAIFSFELSGSKEYEHAWAYVFSEWLPTSGYQPDNFPSFEMYLNNPAEHPQKKHIVDIYVPVKPM
jgi:AraC family transcriptional regulator